jgi:hypothetical protein
MAGCSRGPAPFLPQRELRPKIMLHFAIIVHVSAVKPPLQSGVLAPKVAAAAEDVALTELDVTRTIDDRHVDAERRIGRGVLVATAALDESTGILLVDCCERAARLVEVPIWYADLDVEVAFRLAVRERRVACSDLLRSRSFALSRPPFCSDRSMEPCKVWRSIPRSRPCPPDPHRPTAEATPWCRRARDPG